MQLGVGKNAPFRCYWPIHRDHRHLCHFRSVFALSKCNWELAKMLHLGVIGQFKGITGIFATSEAFLPYPNATGTCYRKRKEGKMPLVDRHAPPQVKMTYFLIFLHFLHVFAFLPFLFLRFCQFLHFSPTQILIHLTLLSR